MKPNSFDIRMRNYENVDKTHLINKMPVILRFDGVCFHSFTRNMKRPFDNIMCAAMQKTMFDLCEEIPGVVFGYTQSDEITLVLADYFKTETQPWFGNVKRKIESVGASMATRDFNRNYCDVVVQILFGEGLSDSEVKIYTDKFRTALFDCRAFNIPMHEVENNLIWRQNDCIRNSINQVGQANFSHKELRGKNQNNVIEMLREKGVDWHEYPIHLQRGTCCYKKPFDVDTDFGKIKRNKFCIDENPPIFAENREFIREKVLIK